MERSRILKEILAEAARGDLHFPTSTMAAMRVRNALDDPDSSLDEVAQLAKADPLMAARVVALANSVVFNPSGRDISDVRGAVARLGFKAVRTVAAAVATRQLVGTPKDPVNRACVAKLWEHTVHVAALAHVLARRVTGQDAETAMFAGIVHEVAGFYLLSRVEKYPGLIEGEWTDWLQLDDGETEAPLPEGAEARLGRTVLKALAVPQSVVDGIEVVWKGYLTLPPTTLGDTLLLADRLTPVHSPLDDPDARDGDQAANIDMIVDDETLAAILAESAGQANSLIAALRF